MDLYKISKTRYLSEVLILFIVFITMVVTINSLVYNTILVLNTLIIAFVVFLAISILFLNEIQHTLKLNPNNLVKSSKIYHIEVSINDIYGIEFKKFRKQLIIHYNVNKKLILDNKYKNHRDLCIRFVQILCEEEKPFEIPYTLSQYINNTF